MEEMRTMGRSKRKFLSSRAGNLYFGLRDRLFEVVYRIHEISFLLFCGLVFRTTLLSTPYDKASFISTDEEPCPRFLQ